jgi:hypothetical protein
MMRKFHEAKENGNAPVTLWEAERPWENFFVDDMAQAGICIRKHATGLFIQRRDRRRFDHQTIETIQR